MNAQNYCRQAADPTALTRRGCTEVPPVRARVFHSEKARSHARAIATPNGLRQPLLFLTMVLACSAVSDPRAAGTALEAKEAHSTEYSAREGDAMDNETLGTWYRFLATLFHECPTDLQVPAVEQAEAIYQLTQGWRKDQMTQEDRLRTSRDIHALYERLREQYATLKAAWTENGVELAHAAPLVVAAGLLRYVFIEVSNNTNASVSLRVALGIPPVLEMPATRIPPGEWRPFAVAVAVSENPRAAKLTLSAEDQTTYAAEIPLTPVAPATIHGTLIEEQTGTPWPGRVYVQCSDNVFRHGKAFADNATLSEKPVIFRPALYKLPFFYSDGHFEISVPPAKRK